MEQLTQAQLLRLYIEYVKYRDSLTGKNAPVSVSAFYAKSKVNLNDFRGDDNEVK